MQLLDSDDPDRRFSMPKSDGTDAESIISSSDRPSALVAGFRVRFFRRLWTFGRFSSKIKRR